jgi:hypothetical protein
LVSAGLADAKAFSIFGPYGMEVGLQRIADAVA